MADFDVFGQDLATALSACAEARRRSTAGGVPTGDDLNITALFDRLASDVETLDLRADLSGKFVPAREPLEGDRLHDRGRTPTASRADDPTRSVRDRLGERRTFSHSQKQPR